MPLFVVRILVIMAQVTNKRIRKIAAVSYRWLLGCCLLLQHLSLSAQKFNFINYHVGEGLIQSQATAFAQDKNNELWIGTFGGVSRFDGTHFTNYNKSRGLAHNMVTDLLCDKTGYLWIGTSFGVSRFNGIHMQTIPFEKAVQPGLIQEIVQDGQQQIWVLMNGSLFRFQDSLLVEDHTLRQITTITIDKIGKLWASVYAKGIYVLNDEGWQPEVGFKNGDNAFVYRMLFGTYSGTLYCLTSHGIKVTDQGKLKTPDWFMGLPEGYDAINLLETSMGEIWLGLSDGGAWKYNRKHWTHYTFKNGMTDDQVHDFFEDAENNIWIATNGSGIYRYGGGLFSYFDRSSGLLTPGIMSIVQDKKGTTFFGGNTAGLYQLSKEGNLHQMSLPSGNKVNALLIDQQNRLWIGTSEQEGLLLYDGQRYHNITRKANVPVTGITHLFQDSNAIWMSAQSGLYKIVAEQVKHIPLPLGGIYTVCSIGRDSLLLGSIKGAYLFKTDEQRLLQVPLVPDAAVLSIESDARHVYIGTDDRGVVVWDKASRKKYTISQKNGLSCDYVYSLLLDRDGNLWVGTGCGIDKINFSSSGFRISNFGKSDGLLGVESNANAAFEGRDGMLWFGTSRGLFIYNPNIVRPSGQVPKLLLQSVQLFAHEIPAGKFSDSTLPFSNIPFHPNFPPKQNHLSFTFKGVYLSNPEKIKYRYQLIGADATYAETELNTVVYPNLPPGDYVFKVWSTDADGYWQDNAVSYPFLINTPYYKTLTFRLAMGLLVMGALLGLVYWRNHQKTRRQQWRERLREEEQARVRQRTAEDFHDEIGNKLTRINLLTTIASGKISGEALEVKGLLQQIQKNVTSLYHGSKDIIWSLQPERDYLDEILFHIGENTRNMLLDTSIQFTYAAESSLHLKLPMDYSRNLIMIFKEAVNNIIKHAGAQHIKLTVSSGNSKGVFILMLSDDGRGFDPQVANTGNGMGNMHSRAARINSKLLIESKPGAGTQLTLWLVAPPAGSNTK